MGRFDRYMLGELVKLFGFFGLVLVLIYWINRAVALFDALIADGQSALVFLELTTLSLPGIIAIVLPFAAFAATAYVVSRLERDSELVVMLATGYSPFRLARPVLVFGLLVMGLMLVLTNILIPKASARLELRQAEIAANLPARLLIPGQFIDAGPGITAYVRDISPEGALQGVLLSDRRDGAEPITYSAAQAYLLSTDDGPRLVMEDGMIQVLRAPGPRLFLTRFSQMSYDVSQLVQAAIPNPDKPYLLPTPDLLRAGPDIVARTGASPAQLRGAGHQRLSKAMLGAIAALIGFAPLMMGGFSRFGLTPQIAAAVGFVIALMAVDNIGLKAGQSGPGSWPLNYLAVGLGAALIVLMLAAASRGPGRRRRRHGTVHEAQP